MNKAFVLGYHGCDRKLGEQLISKSLSFDPGDEKYHWLGAGVYFWEDDPVRALEWAQKKHARGACDDPFVVGAVIDLGNCLDFHTRENLTLLKSAYDNVVAEREALGLKLPTNKKARNDSSEVKVLRFLDHAVIETLHTAAAANGVKFDTVRGTFVEGESVYPDGGILELTHAQIAVRNLSCIRGAFAP